MSGPLMPPSGGEDGPIPRAAVHTMWQRFNRARQYATTRRNGVRGDRREDHEQRGYWRGRAAEAESCAALAWQLIGPQQPEKRME